MPPALLPPPHPHLPASEVPPGEDEDEGEHKGECQDMDPAGSSKASAPSSGSSFRASTTFRLGFCSASLGYIRL